MARGRLASQRVQVPSQRGFVNPTLISDNISGRVATPRISAPQISTRAGRLTYTPLQTEQLQADPVTTALVEGGKYAAVAVESAFKYQERENQLFAKHATMQYQDDMRKLLYGTENSDGTYTQGYLGTKGAQATVTHGDLQTAVNDGFQQVLNGLEPRARQLAMLQMASERDTVLSKASLHRSQQLAVAEEQARYTAQKQEVLNISLDPASIYRTDKVSGLTGKQKFYRNFDSEEEADKAWYDLISEVGEKIYLEQGIEKAREFYSGKGDGTPGVGQVELAMSPEHSTRMLSNIMKWENESIRAINSSRDLQIKQAKADREKLHETTRRNITARIIREQPPTKEELALLLDVDAIDPGFAKTVLQDVYGEVDELPDPGVLKQWMRDLERSAADNFMVQDENYNMTSISMKHQSDPRLDNAGRTFLRNFEMKLKDPDYRGRYTRGKDHIANWFQGDWWDPGLYDRDKESMINDANMELHTRLQSGEKLDDILQDMSVNYNPAFVQIEKLPPLASGAKPTTEEDILRELNIIESLRPDPGTLAPVGGYSNQQYLSDFNNLRRRLELIKEINRQNAAAVGSQGIGTTQ